MIVAFSVSPSGRPEGAGTHQSSEDGSVHDAVAAAVQVVRDCGLPNRTSSMFTDIVDSEHGWRGAHRGGSVPL